LNSNLVTRLLTGLIAIPLLLWLLFGGPAWGWMAFVSVACAVGSLELFGMTHPGDRVSQALGVLLSVGVIQVLWFFGSDVRYVLAAFLLLPLLGLFFTLARLGDIETSARRSSASRRTSSSSTSRCGWTTARSASSRATASSTTTSSGPFKGGIRYHETSRSTT
jgi:CDP-diglyceride synthetase